MKDNQKFQLTPKPGDTIKIYSQRRASYGTCKGVLWDYDHDHFKRHKEHRQREYCLVQLLDYVPDKVDYYFDEYKCKIV